MRTCQLTFTAVRSGIGLCAAKLLALVNPLNRLVLVARTKEKAEYAKSQVEAVLPNNGKDYEEHIIPLECDHCSLSSVRSFVASLRRKLKETYRIEKWAYNGIDVLCLNAALLFAEDSLPAFTEDKLEMTFQTNHLAPFLIAYLTQNIINPGGRVLFSTSGLHVRNKLDLSGVEDPVTGDIRRGFLMIDGTDFHYKRSYSLTKLCNVATCVELNKRLAKRGAISTCFSPGLMLSTGLFRHQIDPVEAIPAAHREMVLRKSKSKEWGAGSLVYMAIAEDTGKRGSEYWSDNSLAGCSAEYGKEFCAAPITDETVNSDECGRLWRVSCRLADVPNDP